MKVSIAKYWSTKKDNDKMNGSGLPIGPTICNVEIGLQRSIFLVATVFKIYPTSACICIKSVSYQMKPIEDKTFSRSLS